MIDYKKALTKENIFRLIDYYVTDDENRYSLRTAIQNLNSIPESSLLVEARQQRDYWQKLHDDRIRMLGNVEAELARLKQAEIVDCNPEDFESYPDPFSSLLGEIKEFISTVAGDNRPSRAWAVSLKARLNEAVDKELQNYPTAKSKDVDPEGEFEKAYAEVAGVEIFYNSKN